MLRMLIYGAAGFVAGYSVARVIECKAQGVPLDAAFALDLKTLLTPVSRLDVVLGSGAPRPPALPALAPEPPPGEAASPYDEDAPLVPAWARGGSS